eukprot:759825-Hanusia_phi.AAC.3
MRRCPGAHTLQRCSIWQGRVKEAENVCWNNERKMLSVTSEGLWMHATDRQLSGLSSPAV